MDIINIQPSAIRRNKYISYYYKEYLGEGGPAISAIIVCKWTRKLLWLSNDIPGNSMKLNYLIFHAHQLWEKMSLPPLRFRWFNLKSIIGKLTNINENNFICAQTVIGRTMQEVHICLSQINGLGWFNCVGKQLLLRIKQQLARETGGVLRINLNDFNLGICGLLLLFSWRDNPIHSPHSSSFYLRTLLLYKKKRKTLFGTNP